MIGAAVAAGADPAGAPWRDILAAAGAIASGIAAVLVHRYGSRRWNT